MKSHPCITLLLVGACTSPVLADEVQVAVAANFAIPLKSLGDAFSKASGHTVLISPEATGKLYAQIINGAPYDVFLSADQATPRKLGNEGNAIASAQFTYAIGKLVLWSAHPNTVDTEGQVLKKGHFKHLAIANAKTAPYGAAAISVMQKLGVHDSLQPKFVQGENIAQTFQFVSTGNAELGFVALSQVYKDGKINTGSAWVIDSSFYTPIKQDAILLAKGKRHAAAIAFMNYLKSDDARKMIQQFGYEIDSGNGAQ